MPLSKLQTPRDDANRRVPAVVVQIKHYGGQPAKATSDGGTLANSAHESRTNAYAIDAARWERSLSGEFELTTPRGPKARNGGIGFFGYGTQTEADSRRSDTLASLFHATPVRLTEPLIGQAKAEAFAVEFDASKPVTFVAHGEPKPRGKAPRVTQGETHRFRWRAECEMCVREAFESAHETADVKGNHTATGPCACVGCAAVYSLNGRCDNDAHRIEKKRKKEKPVLPGDGEFRFSEYRLAALYAAGIGPEHEVRAARHTYTGGFKRENQTVTFNAGVCPVPTERTEIVRVFFDRAGYIARLRDEIAALESTVDTLRVSCFEATVREGFGEIAGATRKVETLAIYRGDPKVPQVKPSYVDVFAPVGSDALSRELSNAQNRLDAARQRLAATLSAPDAAREFSVKHSPRPLPDDAPDARVWVSADRTAPRLALTREAQARVDAHIAAIKAWERDHSAVCACCNRAECPASARRGIASECPYRAPQSSRALAARGADARSHRDPTARDPDETREARRGAHRRKGGATVVVCDSWRVTRPR